jgi:hypothetical protein
MTAGSGQVGLGAGLIRGSFPAPDLDLAELRNRLVMPAHRRREVPDSGGQPEAGVQFLLRRRPDDKRLVAGVLEGLEGLTASQAIDSAGKTGRRAAGPVKAGQSRRMLAMRVRGDVSPLR